MSSGRDGLATFLQSPRKVDQVPLLRRPADSRVDVEAAAQHLAKGGRGTAMAGVDCAWKIDAGWPWPWLLNHHQGFSLILKILNPVHLGHLPIEAGWYFAHRL